MAIIATLTHLITFICFIVMLHQYNKKRRELRETIDRDEEYISSLRKELDDFRKEDAKHNADGIKMNRMQAEIDRLQALKPENMNITAYNRTLESYTKELNKAIGASVERTIIDRDEVGNYDVKILFV